MMPGRWTFGGTTTEVTPFAEKSFRRSLDSLDALFGFVAKFTTDHQVDPATAFVVTLAIEEVFTNLVKYDAGAAPDIPITLGLDHQTVTIVVRNIGGSYFDVTAANRVDVTAPLQDRPIGGLGLHLVRAMLDDVRYEYTEGVGIITIKKSLEAKRA
jgi:serine/threonine-protein kinase RsbW